MSKINEYNPDVLSCISNLSNDEVFTPPEIVKNILDMLPKKIWEDKNATFLDPCCKTGVFLREIAKRLVIGLENQIPDLQERVDHIFHNQLFGIAVTELTSLLSRRSVYCSKYPNCKYSITSFDDIEGNIRFKRVEHTWYDGRCIYCGAPKKEYNRDKSLENYAYEFIHNTKLERTYNMKFDVIIGNPPYQLSDGGAQASAQPIYHLFINQARKLNPRYLCMIVPSRWYSGGKGLDKFREEMLKDNRLTVIHDFPNASDCFNGVEIKGGVNYFLWERDREDLCDIYTHSGDQIISHSKRPLLENNCDVFIRNNSLVSIFRKVSSKNEKSFMSIVSSRKPYGLCGDVFKNPSKYSLPKLSIEPIPGGIAIYGLDEKLKRSKRYVNKDYPLTKTANLEKYKMFVARNQGSGIFGEIISLPIFAEPYEACTETFIEIGPFNTKEEMLNCFSYFKTKFFRAMLGVKKNDQGASRGVYQYIPIQDFKKSWTDEELYKKYNLSADEITFIEENIKSMDDDNEAE